MFAKNEELKHKLQNHWEDLVSVREYTALLSGHLKKNKGRYESYLRESKTLQVYSAKDKNGKLAVTEYEVLDKNKEYDLVQIRILTGRKNQIRVHMSDLGAPIAGDKKYGAKKNPYRRMCLHANKLILEHPRTHKKFIFESEIPTLFYQAVENK